LGGDVTIRRASADDAPAILQCLCVAFEPYRGSYTTHAFLDTVLTPATIQQRLNTMQVFVALDCNGRVVGTIGCALTKGREGHLRGMAVLPEWQGQGIAEKLLRSAEDELAAGNCTRITLDTTEPLLRAARFYEKNGYRRSGRTADFFGMPLREYVKNVTR
jgi:ribosomal protein S18 acetylase RimI-like enzyme